MHHFPELGCWFLNSVFASHHCIVPLAKYSLEDCKCSYNTKLLIVIMMYTNFLKWVSLAMLAVMCMQNIVESTLKTGFFFWNPCPFPASHTAPKQSAMKDLSQVHGFLMPKISLLFLGDLSSSYNVPCFSKGTVWRDRFLQHRIFHSVLCQATGSKDPFNKESRQRQFPRHRVAKLHKLIVLL